MADSYSLIHLNETYQGKGSLSLKIISGNSEWVSFPIISRRTFLQKRNLLYTQPTLKNKFSHRIQ